MIRRFAKFDYGCPQKVPDGMYPNWLAIRSVMDEHGKHFWQITTRNGHTFLVRKFWK